MKYYSMSDQTLTSRQQAVLKLIGSEPDLAGQFYLSGGTALAAFYLKHRYSEDLDFFSEVEFDTTALTAFWQKHKAGLGFEEIDYQQSFNRNLFFLHFENEILKTEFTYYPFKRLEMGESQFGVATDSLRDIAVNKLFSIYQRTAARDYIDLYCIVQDRGWTIDELKKAARLKFDYHIDPLQLSTQFSKAAEAPDLPRMIKSLEVGAWQNFFKAEAKKLRPDILA